MKQSHEKSAGHILFHGDFEFFERGGEVYRAPISAPLADFTNKSRHGRWECSRPHFDRYQDVILGYNKEVIPSKEGC